jgi:cysteine desulfurase
MIYLDNAATTKVSQEVRDAMFECMENNYGNPGSIHSAGRDAYKAVWDAKVKLGNIINGEPEHVIFTSGGSEANNLALMGISSHLEQLGLTHIITTAVEHKSVLNPLKQLSFDGRFDVTYIKPDEDGSISLQKIKDSITDKTGVLSVMGVNNETGNLHDLKALGNLCRREQLLFHTDCVQAFCQTPIDVDEFEIDFLTASAHKIHGPKGVGMLWCRFNNMIDPIILGGKQEFGLRAGTENVPGIVGFGVAAELAAKIMESEKNEHTRKINELNRRLFSELGETIHINGTPYEGSKTINYRFDGIDGETLVLALNAAGIMVSAGSACNSHSAEASHVLKAYGLTDRESRSSIRISLSKYTTMEDIIFVADQIIQSVRMLRG